MNLTGLTPLYIPSTRSKLNSIKLSEALWELVPCFNNYWAKRLGLRKKAKKARAEDADDSRGLKCSSRYWTVSTFPCWPASWRAVAPWLFICWGFSVFPNSIWTTSRWPSAAARCRGRLPSLSTMLASAPCSSNVSTVSLNPSRETSCSTVRPQAGSATFGFAPAKRSSRTRPTWPVFTTCTHTWTRTGERDKCARDRRWIGCKYTGWPKVKQTKSLSLLIKNPLRK